ncbi:bifunctional proline dehydrogenase/L-glutamate gamma-semialdehyde dehydrogenase [Actinomycetospora endophytica]|uniref:L-glutamate gamma-semialdehyde dehydrogenase n=1 Tax=Actinomycetospora endophytica TaxID=2291215 RepID=A0ABS8P851_9PSEU|nr:bifunctional proline dehydrogenase/L-glutamate gamma-semialdehyde dehydrogenase [Actinomycetospora endophytica]MCD2194425.1 bifunctional proline dehydrogenase/L-glutamate gamma-semialdehyde dehydrogenase [Actinomycetospora endophytica]
MSEQVTAPTGGLDTALVERAIVRADRWSAASASGHDAATRRLASLVHDPDGVDFALRFVDRVARPDDDGVAARELARLAGRGATLPGFASALDRGMLRAGAMLAPKAPRLVVPVARRRLEQLVGHLVVDASDRSLRRHLAAARAQGRRLNLNLLGEAVLGEDEADRRLARTVELIRRPDVDYVSVKASSVASQLVPWDLEGSRDRLVERLAPLFATARDHGVFVNLDMEEYKDLHLTVALFTALLDRPELRGYSAGIVLQGYLPDSVAALEHLAQFARRRVEGGGAPVKVRLVKGANLAMERVDAALHDWPQAPYATKAEVDANYVRLLDHALRPELADALRVGVASHHLHHVALAVELAAARGVERQMDVEMLQGMAPAQADAVAADLRGTENLVLYTPVVHAEDFDAAVSYLVRRLEENAGQENYLYAMFSAAGPSSYVDRFRASVRDRDVVADTPRRPQDRSAEASAVARSCHLTSEERHLRTDGPAFHNEPDTDPSLPANRAWARRAVAAPPAVVTEPELTDPAAVDVVVERAAASTWRHQEPAERARLLREAARSLAAARTELLTTMVHEAGKTVTEADPEISESIDFAAYYADRALELPPQRFTPDRVVVVTPPWNFPAAIPLGGCLAALAAGAAVVIKPAPQVRACAEVGVAALHRAGIPADALQLVHTDEAAAGRRLITHPAVERVVLTGASETAALFRSWRPDLGLVAETSGKNALVITPAADPDLAVADLVRSAFGHAGQKCSAASLAILVGSMADPRSRVGTRFRRQLVDAVTTLRVGHGSDLATTMGPLVGELSPKLERALTTLDDGESWLVPPRRVGEALWTPGVRDGVAPGSWFHRTECFGPVLGLMTAGSLEEAVALQNATRFGLTGGLHSLDADEIARWSSAVEVGNAYVNRHITGAIVQRQSFGGWKGSVVGPGAKPGGPNYVAQFGSWGDPSELPSAPLGRAVSDLLASVASSVSAEDLGWLRAAAGSDAYWWREEFSVEHDPTGIAAEADVFRYRPLPSLRVVVGAGVAERDVLRVRLAGACAGVSLVAVGSDVIPEPGERLRVIGEVPTTLREAAARVGASLVEGPVLADGRRELLTVLREQAVSVTRHRFGHVEA